MSNDKRSWALRILSISKTNPSLEEIKTAYKKQSLKYHPDRNNGSEVSHRNFKKVQEAYEYLKNQPIISDEDIIPVPNKEYKDENTGYWVKRGHSYIYESINRKIELERQAQAQESRDFIYKTVITTKSYLGKKYKKFEYIYISGKKETIYWYGMDLIFEESAKAYIERHVEREKNEYYEKYGRFWGFLKYRVLGYISRVMEKNNEDEDEECIY